jgi:hypothetical protein
MRKRRLVLGSIFSILTVLTSFVAVASPAQAYGNLTLHWALVDTDDCRKLAGDLTVIAEANRCRLNDSADNTFFQKDAGGKALKAQLHDGNGMVAKVEFHPYGEKLWVYDTRNDGDTVYFEPFICPVGGSCFFDVSYSALGTSDPIDFDVFNFELPEGSKFDLWIWDNADETDSLGTVHGGVA